MGARRHVDTLGSRSRLAVVAADLRPVRRVYLGIHVRPRARCVASSVRLDAFLAKYASTPNPNAIDAMWTQVSAPALATVALSNSVTGAVTGAVGRVAWSNTSAASAALSLRRRASVAARTSGVRTISKATLIAVDRAAAVADPGFLSGWCSTARRRCASLISAAVASSDKPSSREGSTSNPFRCSLRKKADANHRRRVGTSCAL